MKVIILNGKIGAGKSFVGRFLNMKLTNSAFVEGDSFLQINPFKPTQQNYLLVAKNIANQIKTYKKFKNIDYVVLSWIIFNEDIYKKIMDNLIGFSVFPIYLDCPNNVLQKRIKKDVESGTRYADNLLKFEKEPFKENFLVVNSNQKIESLFKDILKIINN